MKIICAENLFKTVINRFLNVSHISYEETCLKYALVFKDRNKTKDELELHYFCPKSLNHNADVKQLLEEQFEFSYGEFIALLKKVSLHSVLVK